MVKKWSGDGTYYLPARQVEPYRLWFEFLKQAHRDPEIEVDYRHYEGWGNFWDQEFGEWWSGATWRKLFAIDAGVRVLDEAEQFINDEQSITVRLPLGKDPKETLKDVKQLLEQHDAGIKLSNIVQGKFALSEGYELGFLKYLHQANFMLRLYKIWLDNAELEGKNSHAQTAVEFTKWARTRTQLIEDNNYNYPDPVFPIAVETYADEYELGIDTSDLNDRRQYIRYFDKARNLARNAAVGIFPGDY